MHLNISVYYHLYKDQVDAHLQQQALALLDDNEVQRFKRFKVAHAAQQFILGRLLTKVVIAERLNVQPQECRIVLSENGKPALAEYAGLHFSITHCEGAVMVAIAETEIGIDVEREARFKPGLINDHFFSPSVINNIEARTQKNLASSAATTFATLYWTAMEAVAKLEDSSIFVERSQFTMLLDEHRRYEFARDIALVSWPAGTEFMASIAVKNPGLLPLRVGLQAFPGGSVNAVPATAHTAELVLLPLGQS